MSIVRIAIAGALWAGGTGAAFAEAPAYAEVRASQVGRWQGKLEYRDYQSDKWFGLPVVVEVRDGGDGVTLIRTADYDDGPQTGTVRITTVSMVAATGFEETTATFRKGREVELTRTRAAVDAVSADAENWTLVETEDGTDDDRPATIRVTTRRTGGTIVTLKEVDFRDDAKEEWLVRNRTTLTKTR